MRLGRILVFAPDLDRARTFYEGVLGLRLTASTERHLELSGPDFGLVVFLCEGATPPTAHANEPGVAAAFVVDDLDASMAELRGKGVRFLHEVPNSGPLGRYAAFEDPFGTVHELTEVD